MRRALVVVAALIAGLASGCTDADGSAGSAGSRAEAGQVAAMPPADLAGASVTAYRKATSVRVVGTVKTDTTTTFDLRVRGRDGHGSVVIDGRTVEVIRIGDALFLKADASFWRQFMPDQATRLATALRGRYLKVSTADPDFGSLATYFDTLSSFAPQGPIERGDTSVVNGVSVLTLRDADADGGTLYVAAQGEPWPIRLEGAAVQGRVDFSEYNAPVTIAAPAPGAFVDLNTLPEPTGI